MFKASNEISGIDKRTLPTELIPLNSIQLSRGLLNYTVIQSRLNWILPFWAEEQYNPESKSFVPRSHMGLSLNITNRNWTAVGNPDCNIEPIVDPRGLVTPFVNGWSIDIWIKKENKIFFPSKETNVKQCLVDDLPIVKTQYFFDKIKAQSIVSVKGKVLHINISVEGDCENSYLITAIRPFNPEGISLLNSIIFEKNYLLIDNKKIEFDKVPGFVYCSDFEQGDAANILSETRNYKPKYSTYCETGMANAIAVFELKDNFNLNINCMLEENNETIKTIEPKEYWEILLSQGTKITTPDAKLDSVLKSSLSSVLMFCDDQIITPGPFTYHQFWFRDAAYMLYALDKFGFHNFSRKIISTFPEYQDKSGYFRSQKGEWDSNGQALWTIFNHSIIANDLSFLKENFDSLFRGIEWIDETRLKKFEYKKKNIYGLLPKGLSAEHLGLADYYYWDNFWSLAGIRCFINMSKLLNKSEEQKYATALLKEYQNDVDQSIKNAQSKFNTASITPSATRGIDCGIIGSISASYPLQLYEPDDEKILSALDIITGKYFYKGMFLQHFIHSGMNPYLTLQAAHSYLFAGRRKEFIEIFNSVINASSPTNNFPEAIHPGTNGGCMGDGHHGWVSAEILLAAADAFAFEYNSDIYLLGGIPFDWFVEGKSFSIAKLKLKPGIISLNCSSSAYEVKLDISFEENRFYKSSEFIIKIPIKIKMPGISDFNIFYENGETVVKGKCSSVSLIFNKN